MTLRHSPSRGPNSPDVWGLYDEATGSVQYICADPASGKAALIDVLLDFDLRAARLTSGTAERVLETVASLGLEVEWILDTHPHADHVTASAWLTEHCGAPNAIGEKVRDVASLWERYYNLPGAFDPEESYAHLFAEGDGLSIGALPATVWLSPGHTMASITYLVGDAAFVHDTLLSPDAGTARADFPGGSAAELWASIARILSLDGATRLFVGHDYRPGGREAMWEASVEEHRAGNVHVGAGAPGEDEAAFRDLREARDATLPLPDQMLFALQLNLQAGRLPPPEADGHSYLKIPANRF